MAAATVWVAIALAFSSGWPVGFFVFQGAGPRKLLAPEHLQRAMAFLQERFEVSQKRACVVVAQPRST
jgi:hypothetical protein